MKLTYGALTAGIGGQKNFVYLKIFIAHPLIDEGFIITNTLQDFMQHGILDRNIQISTWNINDESEDHSKQTIQSLLDGCDEIKEYARQFYPELAI